MRQRAAFALAALALAGANPARAGTILFVGNSFTFGACSAVMRYHPERVSDLNGDGIGGVPALFKTFADQAGLDWQVSLETSPGKDLAWHLDNKLPLIQRPWDVVVLQGYSTLDAQRPGDPTRHVAAAKALAERFHASNPKVSVRLETTWTRADQTWRKGGHWFGKPVYRMGEDLAAANALALKASPLLAGTIPVGGAWNRAWRTGIADPNPYDGVDFGKANLWCWDQYHASAEGSYLAALTVFGSVTGVDPRKLGKGERAAQDLGLDPRLAEALRRIAAEELGFK